MVSLGIATTACSSGASSKPDTTATPRKKGGELDKVMRTRMNKAYSSLVFQILHSTTEYDYARITADGAELRQAVQRVLDLPPPPVAESEEARSVYLTYNQTLQRNADKFSEAIAQKNRPEMETLLTKIGKTCNDCHKFFRIEIENETK
jgi:cytochrome c556